MVSDLLPELRLELSDLGIEGWVRTMVFDHVDDAAGRMVERKECVLRLFPPNQK